jgi:hypothetical protein
MLNEQDKTNSISKSKKRKVKAWCNECFQAFENGPFTKICKEHFNKGKCNIFECKKKFFNKNDYMNCIRKFPNTNSENRHTYCITEEEAKLWDNHCNIQNCLGVKRNSDYQIQEICKFSEKKLQGNYHEVHNQSDDKINRKISENEISCIDNLLCYTKDKNTAIMGENFHKIEPSMNKQTENVSHNSHMIFEQELSKNNFKDSNDFSLNYNIDLPTLSFEYNLIDQIKNLNFLEEKFSLDENLINEFNNIYFNTPDKNLITINLEKKFSKCSQTQTNYISDKILDINLPHQQKSESFNKNTVNFENNSFTKDSNAYFCELNDKIIKDNDNIDNIFDIIHINTNIPKNILNRLKCAFKRKGIFNAKILKMFKEKYSNFNFLVDQFKPKCSQIEGVALFLENILS